MHDEALGVLEAGSAARRLRDPLGVREQQARLFLALGRRDDAAAAYRALIAINTENHKYHAGLLRALQLPAAGAAGAADAAGDAAGAVAGAELTQEQRRRLAEAYAELQREHPHSVAARRIPLDFLVRWSCLPRAARPPCRRVALPRQPVLLPLHAGCPTSLPLPCASAAHSLQEGDEFVAAADAYVRKYLLRGIPSLFSGERG